MIHCAEILNVPGRFLTNVITLMLSGGFISLIYILFIIRSDVL